MPTSWYLMALSGYPKNPWIIVEFGPTLTQERRRRARPAIEKPFRPGKLIV